jgi:hypothetical protein
MSSKICSKTYNLYQILKSIIIAIFKIDTNYMIAVITGDIINSTEKDSINWLKELKSVLTQYGNSQKMGNLQR